jgi:cyclopropane fatty-acyl-phospholipid synthase-like methyltransferase
VTMTQAIQILGSNRARYELRNMHYALGLMSWLNTAEDTERRKAAAYVLRRWEAYQRDCNNLRNLRRGK